MDFFDASSPWFWVALGMAIGVLELFTGTFLFLGLALAMLPVALIAAVSPDMATDWRFSCAAIAVLWLVFSVALRRIVGARRQGKEAARDVNDY